MEQQMISGAKCAKATGISASYLSQLFAEGKVPGEKTESGRTKYCLDVVKAKLDELGIKPRPRRAKAEAPAEEQREPEVEEAAQEEEELDIDDAFRRAKNRAVRRARFAYKTALLEVIDQAEKAELTALEVRLLRHYVNAEEMFAQLAKMEI